MNDGAPGFSTSPAPANSSLAPKAGELVAVTVDLEVPAERREQLLASFSLREKARYASFAHDQHRFRWGAARGLLREFPGQP